MGSIMINKKKTEKCKTKWMMRNRKEKQKKKMEGYRRKYKGKEEN